MKKTIYVFSSGEIKREENTLCFITEESKKFIPVADVSTIMIFGEISFNKRLLEFISTNEIILHFFNHYGYYIGSFYSRTHYNSGFMTLKQCEHYLDYAKRVELARKFVEGSLENILKNTIYYQNRKGGLEKTITSIEKSIEDLKKADNIEELMAIEGRSKEEYYNAFNIIIKDEQYSYGGREKRPPKTKLNTLISFGNSLLYVTVLSEIYKTHLDPRIGYLHSSNDRRFTLNLDVAEVFKPIIVDRIIFTLTNKNMLDQSCFMKELEGIYLNDKGRKIFIQQYEDKLKQTIQLTKTIKATYQRLIRLELYKIEKHIMNEKEYTPFITKW